MIILGFAVTGGSNDSAKQSAKNSLWKEGATVPVSVTNGHAHFDVPEMDRGASVLVVVSSLSKQPGPYEVQMTARPTEILKPLSLANDGVKRSPAALASKPVTLPPPPDLSPPSERTFHLLVRDGDAASASNYVPVVGVLRAVGDRVQVYVDAQDLDRVGEPVLGDVVATFDNHVFPVASKTMGHARDIDGDGRFTVLMSSWLNRLAGGRHSVDGFVRGADLDPDLRAPFSNRCDMLYLNATMQPGPHLRTILAHEYTHAVTYTSKTFTGPAGERIGQDEEGWLDEALAHLGEDLHNFSRSNLDYRISAFLSCPERYQLVVEDYFAADLFRSHGNRGGTYLFLRWCADRFGEGLLPTLVRSNRRGAENLELATGMTFAALYRAWSTSLYWNGLNSGRYLDQGRRSLDVRSPLDGWQLAGPRASTLVPDGQPHTWKAAGTSSHYVVVEPTRQGPINIEVKGSAEAALQVSAIPLPRDLPHLDLQLGATTDRDGTLLLRARLSERRGTPVSISGIAWEPLVPAANPHASGARRGGLERTTLTQAFDSDRVPAMGKLQSRPIRLEGFHSGDGPLVVKVLGIDAKGRRVAAWGEIDRPGHENELVTNPDRLAR